MSYREAMIEGTLPLDLPDAQLCMALHGNHDEHQCHKKPGHNFMGQVRHECYCGVWW